MVLYRKYRPQKINELDIESVRERLRYVLSSHYRPHAYLFSGPKGTGKTSAARIVAKVLNCEKKPAVRSQPAEVSKKKAKSAEQKQTTENLQPTRDIEPCDNCDACQSIIYGKHIDVLEIDAASNRGIDEVRQLREGIKLAPIAGKYKVYIIDEVHMLTKEAFNALLKTLEEPPAHAVFILATTEPHKLPDTIKSRVSRFNFRIATSKEVIRSLQRVVEGEKIKVENKLLELIADSAEGSFRDATKLLEQAISENALTHNKLLTVLGRDSISVTKFLKMLKVKKEKELLYEIEAMAGNGANFRLFVSDVLNALHLILLVQHGIEKEENLDLAYEFSQKETLELIKLFSRTFIDLKSAYISQLPLEMAVVEWCEK